MMLSFRVFSRGGTWRRAVPAVLAVLAMVALPCGVLAASAAAATTGFGPVTQVPLGSGQTGGFGAISCIGSGDCTAVGGTSGGGAFYVTVTNDTWSTPALIPGTAGEDEIAPHVSCTSAGNCVAVGGIYYNGGGWYATEEDGTWGTATMVTSSGYLTGVSCTADGYCTAVGYEGIGIGEPIVVTESGGTWGSPVEIPGSAGGQGWLNSVSCTSTGNCTAVGYDNGNGNSQRPMVITESAGTWGAPAEIPVSTLGSAYAVSCADAGDCAVVGYDQDNGYTAQPFYASESAGTWGAPVDVPVSGIGGYGILGGVSCPDAGDCAAVGWDGNSLLFYVTESAGIWSAPAEIPVAPGGNNLMGVDCVSAGNCIAVGTASGVPAYTTSAAAPVIPCPVGTKANFRWHYSAGRSAGGWSGTATQACPGSVSMGPQAMDGHLQVAPGATLQAGYDFTLPGNHDSLTLTVSAAQVTFAVRCASGATPSAGTLTVTMPAQSYQVTSDQWYPSGDQHNPATYQGSVTVPDLCAGGQIDLGQGGTFTATLS